jgi:hypothetical protein
MIDRSSEEDAFDISKTVFLWNDLPDNNEKS